MTDTRGLFGLYRSVSIAIYMVVAVGNWPMVDFDLMLRLAIDSRVVKLAAAMVSAFDQARVQLLLHYEMRRVVGRRGS